MKTFSKVLIGAGVVFGLLQLVRPSIPEKAATSELQAPPEVKHILQKDCYSCHSDQRRLSWFDEVQPGYSLVRHDILTAREHLDFSTLGSKPAAAQKAALYEAVNMIQLGAMPLPRFTALHPEAKVTPEELAALKSYLAPWTKAAGQPSGSPTGSSSKAASPSLAVHSGPAVSLSAVQPEFNGVPFDGNFEGWKLLSTTDRGDNNTFRFILGNDIAVKAVASGNISPWPDGTRFAKIAWQQEPRADGLIYPGKFVQVELMVKDASRYKSTEGWGFGRWRGLDLKPYGKDARFVTECTSCHLPIHGNDYVYTMPITPASVKGEEIVNNAAAALPSSLPYQPLGWRPITMYVNPATHRMATLFGNEAAMQVLQGHDPSVADAKTPPYSAGAVLALVTWNQRDDPHWFGARIPSSPQSVEFIQPGSASEANRYQLYEGVVLSRNHVTPSAAASRVNFVTALIPATLP